MGRIISAALIGAALMVGGGASARAAGTTEALPSASVEVAEQLVAEDLNTFSPTCHRLERYAVRFRFECGLPDLEGVVEIELRANGAGFEIVGCPPPGDRVRRGTKPICVLAGPKVARKSRADETPGEKHAAGLTEGFGQMKWVTCAQIGRRRFDCDGLSTEGGSIKDQVDFELSIDSRGFYFVGECSITKVWLGPGAALPCQRMAWNINFPESELSEMGRGVGGDR